MKTIKIVFFVLSISTIFTNCTKEEETTGTVFITIDNVNLFNQVLNFLSNQASFFWNQTMACLRILEEVILVRAV